MPKENEREIELLGEAIANTDREIFRGAVTGKDDEDIAHDERGRRTQLVPEAGSYKRFSAASRAKMPQSASIFSPSKLAAAKCQNDQRLLAKCRFATGVATLVLELR